MKMCKSYVVINLSKSSGCDFATGVLKLTPGTGYSLNWYPTLEAAQAKADEFARSGNIGLIFESKEFRQIQPVPVVVERTECC